MRTAVALTTLGFVALVAHAAHATDKAACLAASDSGQDLRQNHKLVESRQQFIVCAESGCPAVVAQDCAQWLKEVEAAIPTVTLAARDRTGKDLIAVTVLLDGKPWVTSLDGEARPVNPGPHKLTFHSAEGDATEQVLVREGEHDRAITITLGEEAKPPPPTLVAPPVVVPAVRAPPVATNTATWVRPLGLGVGLVGVATLVVAGVFAGVATSDWHAAVNQCGGSCLPNSQAYQTKGNAVTLADWSTSLFITGGVLAATGLLMFVLAPHKHFEVARIGLVRF